MFHFPILKIDTSVTNPRFLVKLVATCNEENFFSKVVYLDMKTVLKFLLVAGILKFQELFFD